MEVSKIEKSFDKLFKSIYGETILVGNSVKLKYLGLADTVQFTGGSVGLLPKFEFVSTNKSFTYGLVNDTVNTMCSKILKYLGLGQSNVIVTPNLGDVPDLYLIEDDQNYLDKTFMGLNKLTLKRYRSFGLGGESETADVGHLMVSPLSVTHEFDKDGANSLYFNFNFFIKSGQVTLRDDSELTLPADKEWDPILEEYLKMALNAVEIDSIVDTLVSRILTDEPIDSVYTFLNPSF